MPFKLSPRYVTINSQYTLFTSQRYITIFDMKDYDQKLCLKLFNYKTDMKDYGMNYGIRQHCSQSKHTKP